MRLLGVVGSVAGGRTDALVGAVLAGAGADVATACVHLGHGPYERERVQAELAAAGPCDAVVLGTPMYRGTYAGVLKDFLDDTARGSAAEDHAGPLRATAVAVVATGASDHHYLGLDPLLSMLPRFFGAFVVPPGVYASPADFGADGRLQGRAADCAAALGSAATAMAEAIARDPRLAAVRPQV
jgi:FMN reductase